jgi:hypothetical protein
MPEPEAGAQCGSPARWDLTGGPPAKGGPYRDQPGVAQPPPTAKSPTTAKSRHRPQDNPTFCGPRFFGSEVLLSHHQLHTSASGQGDRPAGKTPYGGRTSTRRSPVTRCLSRRLRGCLVKLQGSKGIREAINVGGGGAASGQGDFGLGSPQGILQRRQDVSRHDPLDRKASPESRSYTTMTARKSVVGRPHGFRSVIRLSGSHGSAIEVVAAHRSPSIPHLAGIALPLGLIYGSRRTLI